MRATCSFPKDGKEGWKHRTNLPSQYDTCLAAIVTPFTIASRNLVLQFTAGDFHLDRRSTVNVHRRLAVRDELFPVPTPVPGFERAANRSLHQQTCRFRLLGDTDAIDHDPRPAQTLNAF